MNLLQRGIVHKNHSPICERDKETVKYTFMEFPINTRYLRLWSQKKLQKCTDKGLTFVNVIENLMGRCYTGNLELMTVVTRKIWFCKNIVVHGGEFTHPNQVF